MLQRVNYLFEFNWHFMTFIVTSEKILSSSIRLRSKQWDNDNFNENVWENFNGKYMDDSGQVINSQIGIIYKTAIYLESL